MASSSAEARRLLFMVKLTVKEFNLQTEVAAILKDDF